ncbi:MAG TPA: hypothetical protein VL098_07240 [Flavipsychrobacter sp.]|nr:hypothetical protein [Flavipsychrobacter sp.]
MKKRTLLHTLVVGAMFSVAFQSCKKENGIDNEKIIKKPYGLYATDIDGQLLHSTDGEEYDVLLPAESYPARALTYSAAAIYWLKGNLHVSRDNGQNFNPALTLQPVATPTPWQTSILSAMDQNRVYVTDQRDRGIYLTDDDGKNWFADAKWDEGLIAGNINSLAQLMNGTMFARSETTDSIYRKDNKDDNWSMVVPDATKTQLPDGQFFLSRYNNELIATDRTGKNGVFHTSDATGWTAYTGLPKRALYTTIAPLDEVLLVGTDSFGVYRLQGNQFVPSNNGLTDYSSVYGIAGKEVIYKNNIRKTFIFLATNKGLFRSEDVGNNWVKVNDGSYIGVH